LVWSNEVGKCLPRSDQIRSNESPKNAHHISFSEKLEKSCAEADPGKTLSHASEREYE
jgi:hypothetical protein